MTTTSIHTCRYCEYTSSKGLESICPSCGRILKGPNNSLFTSPNYLYYQKNSLLEEAKKDKLYVQPDKMDMFKKDLLSKLSLWVRMCPTEDKTATLYDAALILENILCSPTPPQDIKTLVFLGKKIGALANAVDEYFKAGGAPYDREVRQLRPESGNDRWNQAAASASRGEL